MFTGIITDMGRVRAVVAGGDTRIEIETAYDMSGVEIGASIACSGACLTPAGRSRHLPIPVPASADACRH